MDKNTIVGFLLIGVVLFAFSWMNKPSEEQLEARKRYSDSIAVVEQERAEVSARAASLSELKQPNVTEALSDSAAKALLSQQYGMFSQAMEGSVETLKLENELLSLTLSNKGGRIIQAQLKSYQTYDSLPLFLFEEKDNEYGFLFKANGRIISTTDLYFTPIKADNGKSVVMRLLTDNGSEFDLIYTLEPNSYMVKLDIRQRNMDKVVMSNVTDLNFFWSQSLRRQEKGRKFEENNSALYYKFYADDELNNLNQAQDDKKEVSTSLKWIGYKNQFFTSAFIADEKFIGAVMQSRVDSNSDKYLKKFNTETSIDYSSEDTNVGGFRIFLGPNLYPLLASYDDGVADDQKLELDRLIPLGWSIFRYINTWLIIPLFTFLGHYLSNYGIIILILTIVIKLLLAPLTYKSYMSTAKTRVLRPQIEEINAKYPGQDKAVERQKATMDLYGKAGVNPMSGCMPMLLQMPILFAMFSFFPSSIELRQESFLWAHDLSSYDSIFSWDTYIPIITPYFGNHISLFCLLMTITNILSTRLTNDATAGQQQMPGMKVMMYMMPLMFLFIFNNYASGLSYYYFISTLITVIQTLAFRYFIDEKKVLAKLEENKKKPQKKSGFMARLEEAQRQQQAQMRKQQGEK